MRAALPLTLTLSPLSWGEGAIYLRNCAFMLATAFFAALAIAQPMRPGGYPTKPVRVLVGNAPGGGIDITARAVSQKLSG